MVEVFFCSAPTSEKRRNIAELMSRIWHHYPVRFIRFTPEILGVSYRDFQMKRRFYAEETAKGHIYILTDDDCELISPNPIKSGMSTMGHNPHFGILSAWPNNCVIQRWSPEDYQPKETMQVMEHHSVGGIRFIRKGCLTHGWPEQTKISYDSEHCQAVRNSGYRVGYFQHVRMNHWGEGETTLNYDSSIAMDSGPQRAQL